MWATLGKSRQDTERPSDAMGWSSEDPIPGSPTTMRLKNNFLTRTPLFCIPRSIPAMLHGTLSNHYLNIFFIMSNSTAMCHHAKCDIKSSFHKPSFGTKTTISIKTEANGFSPTAGKIPGTHLQERPRYWVRTSRTSWGLDPAPLAAWKKKKSSPSENKHCYSNWVLWLILVRIIKNYINEASYVIFPK